MKYTELRIGFSSHLFLFVCADSNCFLRAWFKGYISQWNLDYKSQKAELAGISRDQLLQTRSTVPISFLTGARLICSSRSPVTISTPVKHFLTPIQQQAFLSIISCPAKYERREQISSLPLGRTLLYIWGLSLPPSVPLLEDQHPVCSVVPRGLRFSRVSSTQWTFIPTAGIQSWAQRNPWHPPGLPAGCWGEVTPRTRSLRHGLPNLHSAT